MFAETICIETRERINSPVRRAAAPERIATGSDMSEETDARAFIAGCAAGERQALEGLYRLYEKRIYRFVTSKMNDPHEAGDIVHEVFLEVWRSASKFEGRSPVRTWLFGIAYRKTMDRFRRSARMTVTDEPPEVADDAAPAFDLVAGGEEAAHLRACLGELSPEHRLAIELAFFEDMPYREIAATAGVPEGTVKTRVFHAKNLLRRCLSARLGVRI